MKKVLYGTSAIVAASLVSGAAFADKPEMTISGDSTFGYEIADTDGTNMDGPDGDNIDAGNSATEIWFNAEGTADNGLTYGTRVEWRWSTNGIDEGYVYFDGGWGRLHFGGDDSVIDNMVPGGESVTAGDWLWDGNFQPATNANGGAAGGFASLASSTFDGTKFSYYSPSFGGFSVGATYTPNVNSGGFNSGVVNGANGNGNQFGAAASYDQSIGAADVSLAVGYEVGQEATGNENREGLMAGATVGIAGFNVGVGYGDSFDTGCASTAANCDGGGWWNVAANYGFGAFTLYGGYMQSYVDVANDGAGEDELDQYGIGLEYAMAEGLATFAELEHADSTDASTNTSSDGTSLVLGTSVSY